MFCLMDDEGVIHITKPDSWRVEGGADGSGCEVLHKQVGYQWANGVSLQHAHLIVKYDPPVGTNTPYWCQVFL